MSSVPIFQTEDALPPQLGELDYAGMDAYADPRLGVTIRYERGITQADIYLYDLGLPSIPSDLQAEEVKEFFRQAMGEVLEMGRLGRYTDLETRNARYLHIPADAPQPLCLFGSFYYRKTLRPGVVHEGFRHSHLFLRTDCGFINKVRYTFLDPATDTNNEEMIQFLFDWYDAVDHASAVVRSEVGR